MTDPTYIKLSETTSSIASTPDFSLASRTVVYALSTAPTVPAKSVST